MRAFVALQLPEWERHKLHESFGMLKLERIAMTNADGMHITLKFFDDLDLRHIEAVKRCIDSVAASTLAFSIRVGGLATFGGKNPHVLFARITRGMDECVAVHDRLLRELAALGINGKGEREYVPHITLARIRRSTGTALVQLGRFPAKDFGDCAINTISLFSSVASTGGGYAHKILHTARMQD